MRKILFLFYSIYGGICYKVLPFSAKNIYSSKLLNNTNISSFDSSSISGLSKLKVINLDSNTALETVAVNASDNLLEQIYIRYCEKLSDVAIEDNGVMRCINLDRSDNLTAEGLKLADSYEKLNYLDLNIKGLEGTFKAPAFKSTLDNWNNYVGPQLVLNGSGIEKLDLSSAENLAILSLTKCMSLKEITGFENLHKFWGIDISGTTGVPYLDLQSLIYDAITDNNYLNISGTSLAYLNIPDTFVSPIWVFQGGNLQAQSIDVEIGGYDEAKGYWVDLSQTFPGIVIDQISNLADYDANGQSIYTIDGNRLYGIAPDSYVTYDYAVNSHKLYTIRPVLHFRSIALPDPVTMQVGITGVEITLPGGSVAESNGTFTTPGKLTVNEDGTVTTENGTRLTIPNSGSVVTGDGKVTLPQGDVTYVDSGRTLTVPDGAVVNPDGTITWPKGDIAVNPDGSVTLGNGNTVKPDGDVQIDGEGNILLPDGGSIIKPDGTEKPIPPGTTVFPDGTTDEEETPTDPGEGDPTNPGGDPTDPGEDPTNPGGDPTDPGEDPTNPGEDPTNPGGDPTDPGENPTNPGEQPTDPDNGQNPSEPTPDQGNTGNGGNQSTGSTQTGTQTTTPGGEGSGTATDGQSGTEGISGQSTGNTQTGDSSQVTLWAGLLSVSAMVLGFLGFKRRKQNI